MGQRMLPSWYIFLLERRHDKSFANDLVDDRGIVNTRAVFSLRFVESKPQVLPIFLPEAWAQNAWTPEILSELLLKTRVCLGSIFNCDCVSFCLFSWIVLSESIEKSLQNRNIFHVTIRIITRKILFKQNSLPRQCFVLDTSWIYLSCGASVSQ